MDLLRELVHGDVGGGCDEDLPLALFGQVVYYRGRGHRLSGARGPLDQAQGLLQHGLHRRDLAVVQLGQPRHGVPFGQHRGHRLWLHSVPQKLVVQVRRDRGLIDGEGLHRVLHAVEGGGLPHKVHAEAMVQLHGDSHVAAQLHGHLLIRGEPHHVAHGLPRLALCAPRVPQPELVPRHEADLVVLLGVQEVRDVLLVQTHLPPHGNAVLALRLLHRPVVLCLQPHQRPKHALVVVGVLVVELHRRRLVVGARALQVLHEGLRGGLPQVLQLIDLLCRDLPGAVLLLLRGNLDQPRQELPVLDERGPVGGIPLHLLQLVGMQAGVPAQQHHN
eukprot:RCo020884